jgi:hypothetical protein
MSIENIKYLDLKYIYGGESRAVAPVFKFAMRKKIIQTKLKLFVKKIIE